MTVIRDDEGQEKIKMYCVYAMESLVKMKDKDGVNLGKMSSMSGHAFSHALFDAMDHFPDDLKAYRASLHAYKITLVVDTVNDLIALYEAYTGICATTLVKDAGYTVFTEPTIICAGFGPIPESRLNDDMKSLKLLRKVK